MEDEKKSKCRVFCADCGKLVGVVFSARSKERKLSVVLDCGILVFRAERGTTMWESCARGKMKEPCFPRGLLTKIVGVKGLLDYQVTHF